MILVELFEVMTKACTLTFLEETQVDGWSQVSINLLPGGVSHLQYWTFPTRGHPPANIGKLPPFRTSILC